MVISIWWLIPAAMFGACVGLVVAALCLSAARDNGPLDTQESALSQPHGKPQAGHKNT